MSTENLQYLTSEQALADFANFIQTYTTQNPELAKVPWIAFGGSYSGSLAAWLKLKYPHLISGNFDLFLIEIFVQWFFLFCR